MTGPEHYRAAEMIAQNVENEAKAGRIGVGPGHLLLAAAQVHATLALAAATALTDASPRDFEDWFKAASVDR